MRRYSLFYGSVSFFDKALAVVQEPYEEFLEKVTQSDAARLVGNQGFQKADHIVVRNNYFHAITEQAHGRLGPLLEDLTTEDAIIYVHNPTVLLESYLHAEKRSERITLTEEHEPRSTIFEAGDINAKLNVLTTKIIGQEEALASLAESILYLTKVTRKNPYVVMLYGKSSLGKTETAKAIADGFFDGQMLEKHLSMFANETYADYFFGGKPNTISLGYELDERTSNMVFLDEIDKCSHFFYSAFYSLFDNSVYLDSTYRTDISGLFIILTCNYLSQDEIRKSMGDPLYYRIDKFVEFTDFSSSQIQVITDREIETQIASLKEHLEPEEVKILAYRYIKAKGENGRTIRVKVRESIETLLFVHHTKDIDPKSQ